MYPRQTKLVPLWRLTEYYHFPQDWMGTCTNSLAMVVAAVHVLGTCSHKRSDLFIVTFVDLWAYAAL